MAGEWPQIAIAEICEHSAFGPSLFRIEFYATRRQDVATLYERQTISADGSISNTARMPSRSSETYEASRSIILRRR